MFGDWLILLIFIVVAIMAITIEDYCRRRRWEEEGEPKKWF